MTHRPARWRARRAAPVAGLVLLLGCKDQKAAAPVSGDPMAERAIRSAEDGLLAVSKAPSAIRFRGVTAFIQAQPRHFAVCGQVTPFADDPNIFVPFVSLVVTAAPDGPPRDQVDQVIGTTTSDATRVYAAIVASCWAGSGAPAAALRSVAPTPPLPDAIPDPAAPATPDARERPAAPPTGQVTLKQSATLHADPHGASLRTVTRGTSLHVFGQAPGGWVQVGDQAPFGWIHESMLERH